MRLIKIIILFLFIPCLLFPATYYMDATDGDNAKDGLSPANAWKTIAYLQTQSLSAGDSVLFQEGEIWREQYTVQYSGSSGNNIFHGAYGSGADPIINGADTISTWTAYSPTLDTLDGPADMEEGDLTDWDATNAGWGAALTADGTQKHGGSYSAKITTPGDNRAYSYGEYTLAGNDSNYSVEYYLYWDATSSMTTNETGKVLDVLTDVSGEVGKIIVRYNGSIWQISADGGTDWDTLSTDTWIKLSLSVVENAWTFYMDDVNKDTGVYGIDAGQFRFGVRDFSGGTIVLLAYVDDCIIYDATPVENVWQATSTTEPKVLTFNDTLGTNVSGISSIDSEKKWDVVADTIYVYYTEDPDGAVTIEASIRDYAINFNSKDYITVDNIHAKMCNDGGFFWATGDNLTIQNCLMDYSNSGIVTWLTGNSANVTINNNTIRDCGPSHAMDLQNNSSESFTDFTIANNVIHDITGTVSTGIHIDKPVGTTNVSNNTIYTVGAAGMMIGGVGYGGTGTFTINNNIVYDWARGVIDRGAIHFNGNAVTSASTINNNTIYEGDDPTNDWQSGGIFIDTATPSGNLVIRYNYIRDSNGSGIRVHKTDSLNIAYNIIENCGKDDTDATYRSAGIAIHGGVSSGTSNDNEIYNNVIYLDDNTQTSYGIQLLNFQDGEVEGTIIKNNVIYHDAAAGYAYVLNDSDATATIDYNLYFPTISTGEMRYNATDYNSFALWQAASHDVNGIESDPKFTDAAGSDFTLQSTSPCRDAGASVGLTLDYIGNTVPFGSAPDIGAYEYRVKGSMYLYFRKNNNFLDR